MLGWKQMMKWPSMVFLSSSMLIASLFPCLGEWLDHRLIGAWVTSASDCAEVFEKRGGRVNFRQPVDQFKSAVLIGPRVIDASGGRCRIERESHAANVTTLSLECINTVGYGRRTSRITVLSDIKIQYEASVDSPRDVTYEKCPF
jgi:hypothetical protein